MGKSSTLNHILGKVEDAAAGGVGALSTGEALMAALVLNRPDWLANRGYTIAEAMDRVGAEWMALLPEAARQFQHARAQEDEAREIAKRALAITGARAGTADDGTIHCDARLVTTGSAPGYRDASIVLNLFPAEVGSPFRVDLRIRPDDAEPLVAHLREVHTSAWQRGSPLDAKPGEVRPRWIDL